MRFASISSSCSTSSMVIFPCLGTYPMVGCGCGADVADVADCVDCADCATGVLATGAAALWAAGVASIWMGWYSVVERTGFPGSSERRTGFLFSPQRHSSLESAGTPAKVGG